MPARRTKVNQKRLAARGRRGWSGVSDNLRKEINDAARQTAANILNDLAEKGPGYSGKFRDNWIAISLTGTGTSSGGYPYSTRSMPQLDTKAKTLNRVAVFEIVNTSSYAMQAMDLAPSRWKKPKGVTPIGGIEFGKHYGTRKWGETFRWEVSGGNGEAVSTAEQDWYINYVRGGEMSAAAKRAIKFAFK